MEAKQLVMCCGEMEVTLTENMLGTVAKNKEVYATYIESKKPKENNEDESETVEEIEEGGWTGFHKDGKGLFVYDYFAKAFFKNSGNVLKEQLGIEALKSKIQKYFFVFPRRIYLINGEGNTIQEPHGVFERPLRGMTAQGPRVSLARSDYVEAGTKMNFTWKLLANQKVTSEVLDFLLQYGELEGFGQFRNGGFGRFKAINVVQE